MSGSAITSSDAIAVGSAVIAAAALITSVVTYRGAVRAATRPVLVFSLRDYRHWRVQNVGAGPAVRLIVADIDKSGAQQTITNCYPLAAGESLDVSWHKLGTGLVAQYEDSHGRAFSTTCRSYVNAIKREYQPRWQCETEQWLQQRRPANPGRPLLETTQLRGMTVEGLDLLRSEPYARLGYRFSRPELLEHYQQFSWYSPGTDHQREVEARFSPEDEYETRLILLYQRRQKPGTSRGAL